MSAATLNAENPIPIAGLAASIEPPVHRTTATRWITHGVQINGVVIRLEGFSRGLGWYTTRAAYHRFLDAATAARRGTEATTPDRTPAARKRGSSEMRQGLAKIFGKR